jgi:hypothetical protein
VVVSEYIEFGAGGVAQASALKAKDLSPNPSPTTTKNTEIQLAFYICCFNQSQMENIQNQKLHLY